MGVKCKYNVGDKVRIKRHHEAGKIGVIIGIANFRLYGRRTFIVDYGDGQEAFVSYELELLSPANNEALEKEINKNNKTTKTKIVLEFDHDPFTGIDSKTAQYLKQTASKIAVDETILKNRYGESGVKAKTITVTLSEAQKMYKLGGAYRDLALKLFTEDELNPKPQVPHSWDEYCKDFYPFEHYMHYTPNFSHGFHGDDCDALIAYGKLIRLHRAWIGDWHPDWNIETSYKNPKYCIIPSVSGFLIEKCNNWMLALSFPTYEMAKDFKNCFIALLEKAKNLIS